jgi:formate hydrogenlyase subunit 3/multisubunit Na+/H+ antiporter MnhD subunit
MGYMMLIDIGAVMLGIGLGTRTGVEAALATLAVRGLALPMWAAGLDYLRRMAGSDSFEALRGFAWRHPVAAIAIVLGVLSLAGFPLTAGFTGRWALFYLLAQIHPTAAFFLLLGTVSTGFVCARALATLLAGRGEAEAGGPTEQLHPIAIGLYGLGFVVLLVVGLFPQWVLPPVAGIAAVFGQIGQ